jgi:hypothetical protein
LTAAHSITDNSKPLLYAIYDVHYRDIGEGKVQCPELLGDEHIKAVLPDDAFDVPLAAGRIDGGARRELIERYTRGNRSDSSSSSKSVDQTQSGSFSSTFEHYDAAPCEPFNWT